LTPSDYAGEPAKNETPDIVSEYHYIQRYGLPWEGGSWDQPSLFMEMMNVIENTKQSVERIARINERIKNGKKLDN
jgi:hypothetical protein